MRFFFLSAGIFILDKNRPVKNASEINILMHSCILIRNGNGIFYFILLCRGD